MSASRGEDDRRGTFDDFMFGDFMFGAPSFRDESSSSEMPAMHNSPNESSSDDEDTLPEEQSIDCRKSRWKNSVQGNTQTRICWADGNMWEFRIRRRMY
ncbi:hypothetical protein [Bacillus sp. USDA818B3_A]|uniref:hypothetical protein n=1 Tax=Bacillus sp. USDA818B3_A TaxID=2698834 RepID=UPI0013693369|nr:hypothetical protein [Bacillus sp. USDA818B3_A]